MPVKYYFIIIRQNVWFRTTNSSQKEFISTYNNWYVLYKNNKIIGYVDSLNEADKICQEIPEYSWDYGLRILKDADKRNKKYN